MTYRSRRYRYRRPMSPGQKAAVAAVCAVLALGTAGNAAAKTHHHRHGSAGAAVSGAAAKAVAYERARLGDPYVWGGTGPDGYDCSGLTMTAWASAGVAIPRTSEGQWAGLRHVARPRPGDLVFSEWAVADNQPSPNHVQMYVGHGYVIGADTTDVERVRLSTDAGHIVGYARPTAGRH